MGIFLAVIIIIGVTVYTASYAVWNWKNGNRLGAIAVFAVCLATIALPFYMYFFAT